MGSLLVTNLTVPFLDMGCSWLPWKLKRRKPIKHEEEFFLQNGAALLEKQVSYYKGRGEAIRIFKAEELRKATNDYEESRVIGRTNFGVVYKGTLDDHVVAIRNHALSHGAWIDYSINEIVILSQINHRNVIKLLGCCLETRIPSLIYEFVSDGTSLYDHIYTRNKLSWDDRLRICVEIAEALVYMQSAFEVPIIHGDVKLSSILLDEYLVAIVSQFGFSRLVSTEKTERYQTERDTGVMWVTENLDPEFNQTGRLTEKSDVYSFGIVLVEILTGRKSLSMFVSSMEGNGLSNVMDASILREGKMMQCLPVAELAKNCLQSRGDNRPTIKEVALELKRIKTL